MTLGDLQPSWLETLDRVRLPKLGVYGNHDDEPYMTWFGIDNVHLNQIDLDSGMSFSGLRGLRGLPALRQRAVGPSYTQQPGRRSSCASSRPPTCCSATARRAASTTTPTIRRTSATRRCAPGCSSKRPRWLLHGHTHPSPGQLLDRIGDTRVVYVNGARISS